MAVDTTSGNANMDYAEHQQTYKSFVHLLKYSAAAIAVVLILMKIFLV